MISGAHVVIYSKDPVADRAFFKNFLSLPNIDVGDGWLIFGLPQSELAVHPAADNDRHELYLMCDDIESFIAAASDAGIDCTPAADQGWGVVSAVELPGGGQLGVYQPRHGRPGNPPAS